ncbi:MAG: DUF5658 family protein [Armatimonadota bacterium]
MSVETYNRSPLNTRSLLAKADRASWFPAALYFLFGMADLFFSLMAFQFGVAEGNPFMAWLVTHGLFVPGKILLSFVVTGLMVVVYSATKRFRWTVWSGVTLMAGVVAYHMWALPRIAHLPTFASFL